MYNRLWNRLSTTQHYQEPVKAEIAGFPAGKKLHIHGFDVSNETNRMFLVNHHSEASSIEVLKHSFDIMYQHV